MSTRAKMSLIGIVPKMWGGFECLFQCVYDQNIPEDMKFMKATPSGECRMSIDNPEAIKQLTIGKQYYFDITQCD
jgi:hypothetical protein